MSTPLPEVLELDWHADWLRDKALRLAQDLTNRGLEGIDDSAAAAAISAFTALAALMRADAERLRAPRGPVRRE